MRRRARRVCPAQDREQLAEQIAVGLSGSLNLRRTALKLVGLLQPRLADWVMVLVPDGRTGELVMLGDAEPRGVVVARARLEGLPLSRILLTGQTEQIEGSELSGLVPFEPFRASAAALVPAEALGFGLTARGTTFGVLVMLRRTNAGFSADDVAFAQRIAARASMALDSARLYEETARVASVLQQHLRPPELPEIPGLRLAARYRPAAAHLDVSGDFYDVTGQGDDWLVALGDVCGKGVEAAAVTGQARQSIRTAAHFDRHPPTILSALNSVLHQSNSAQFVTVLCARLRPHADGTHTVVDLATAGHPAPLVIRADGRVDQVDVYGMAVGLVAEMRYGAASLHLEHGDTMLMFTDGVDEARGATGQYGMERLHSLLPAYAGASPEIICEAVERDVMEYLDGRPHDDMALLAVTCSK
ncbi:serine/threonine protein phosphatase [Mycobacterium sp. ACS1612]|nr:serine/threonine protein phosphatase [Mycobacterium sp. ACS1612]